MVFTDIRLQNFRSYSDSSFELGSKVVIVVGPNAAGKTNLIEALMMAACGKTYRNDEQFVRSDQAWARIDVHTKDNDERTIKFKNENNNKPAKEFTIEEKQFKRLPARLKQPVVLFEPNDLIMLQGEPTGRRKFIDYMASQLSNTFQSTLDKYKKTLAQRNALLKTINKPDQQLFVWNVRLTELAGEVVAERLNLIDQINKHLSQKYSLIAGQKTNLKAEYISDISTKNYSGDLIKKLEANAETDLLRGFTGLGPHRDDIKFVFGPSKEAIHASRGEARSLVLALKLIELELVEKHAGVKPLLLLDDVFSELDGQRRKTLTNHLKDHQTIITTTDADIVAKNFSQKTQIIALS